MGRSNVVISVAYQRNCAGRRTVSEIRWSGLKRDIWASGDVHGRHTVGVKRCCCSQRGALYGRWLDCLSFCVQHSCCSQVVSWLVVRQPAIAGGLCKDLFEYAGNLRIQCIQLVFIWVQDSRHSTNEQPYYLYQVTDVLALFIFPTWWKGWPWVTGRKGKRSFWSIYIRGILNYPW